MIFQKSVRIIGLGIVLLIILFYANSTLALGRANQNGVEFVWSGAVTTDSATVNAKLESDSSSVRLILSTQQNLSAPLYSTFYTATTATNRVVSISTTGLTPNTQYYYAIEADGAVYSDTLGKLHTFPNGPASFTFAMSGDANTGSSHPVFGTILAQNPLFFLHLGDMYYADITSTNVSLYRAAFGQPFYLLWIISARRNYGPGAFEKRG